MLPLSYHSPCRSNGRISRSRSKVKVARSIKKMGGGGFSWPDNKGEWNSTVIVSEKDAAVMCLSGAVRGSTVNQQNLACYLIWLI